MKPWTLVERLTCLGVIIAALTLFAIFVVPEVRRWIGLQANETDAQRLTQPTLLNGSESKTLVFGKTAANVQELRQRNQVSRIKRTESGLKISEVPPGSFGFADSVDLIHEATVEVDLRARGHSLHFEIHRLGDAQAEFVSYVGAETADRLRRGLDQNEKLTLYSSESTVSPNVIALPLGSLLCDRVRIIDLEDRTGKTLLVSALDCRTPE